MQYYITGTGFIRYTTNNWLTAIQVFEGKYTLQSLNIEGYQQISKPVNN